MEFSLFEQLDSESSRANFDFVSTIVAANESLFDELVQIAFTAKAPVSFRAAAVVETICRDHPSMILPYVDKIIHSYKSFSNDGVKRGFFKSMRGIDFTEEQMGYLVELGFYILTSQKEKVAAKVYAMDILVKIGELYPELKSEIALVIETSSENNSAGWQVHARDTIKKLKP